MPKFITVAILIIITGLVVFSTSAGNKKDGVLETGQIKGVDHTNREADHSNEDKGREEFIKNKITENMENRVVTFNTNKGSFSLEIFSNEVPKTAENFLKLAGEGFYDGTRFHRVIPSFMVQGGDPLSKDVAMKARWGTGDPGYKFDDEFGEGLSNVIGTISMANSGPNTNGSQFFINTADNTFLDGKHSVFGKIVEGIEIITAIEGSPTDPTDKPLEDVVVESVVVK